MSKDESSSTVDDSEGSVRGTIEDLNDGSRTNLYRRFRRDYDSDNQPGAYAIGGPGHDSARERQGSGEGRNENLPVAILVDEEEPIEEVEGTYKSKSYLEISLLILSSITIFVCVYVFSESDNTQSSLPILVPTLPPTMSLQPTITFQPTTNRLKLVKELLIPISEENLLDDPKSIQNYAWNFVGATDWHTIPLSEPDKIIQRYATIVVGMSLINMHDFDLNIVKNNILMECDIFTCNEDGEIVDIVLFNNWNVASSGTIAKEIGQLKKLKRLVLRNNLSIGTIPTEIGMLTNLTHLDLGMNKLTGPIPSEIGELKNLKWLIFSQNKLQESIPDEIGKMNNLFFGDFSSNSLHGNIPRSINSMDELKGLDLQMNNLSGDAEFICDKKYPGNLYILDPDTRNKLYYGKSEYNLTLRFDITLDCDDQIKCSCCPCS